jgi:hypothetical protein
MAKAALRMMEGVGVRSTIVKKIKSFNKLQLLHLLFFNQTNPATLQLIKMLY